MFGKLEEPYQKGDDWIEFIFLVAIPSEIESKMESELLELYDDIFSNCRRAFSKKKH